MTQNTTETRTIVPHAFDEPRAIQRVKVRFGWDIKVVAVRIVEQHKRDRTYEVTWTRSGKLSQQQILFGGGA